MTKKTMMVFFLLMFLRLYAHPDLAAAQYFTSISPPVKYVNISPGETFMHTITISNKTLSTQKYSISAVDFKSDGVSGTPKLQKEFSFPYIKNEKKLFNEIVLNSNESKQILLEIDIPLNATPREYPFTVLFSQEALDATSEHALAQVAGSIASNVIVSVSENNFSQSSTPDITSIRSKKVIDSLDAFVIKEIKAHNTSPFANIAEGSIQVHSQLGKQVANFSIYPDILLGNSTRYIRSVLLQDSLPEQTLIVEGKFFFGKYTISHRIEKEGKVIPIGVVYAFPFKITGLIITITLLLKYLLSIYLKPQTEISS